MRSLQARTTRRKALSPKETQEIEVNRMKPRIGLFAGGIETYWKDTGMPDLPGKIEADAQRLVSLLAVECEVIYPGLAGNVEDCVRIGRELRDQNVDLVLVYHATYVDDAMTLALVRELGDIFTVFLHSQGLPTFIGNEDLVEAGRTWGNNSMVQVHGTLKRTRPGYRYGFVFGTIDSPRVLREISTYARAASAVAAIRGKRVTFLPHRSLAVPMFDTFPDETKMIGQTGIEIDYLGIIDLVKETEAVEDADTEALVTELYDAYEVVEPSREEMVQAARQAIALERLVEKHSIDALAIEFGASLMTHTGTLPCLGMARLADNGTVVTSEGDLATAVAGLLIRELSGKSMHFWEHLAFDEEKNYVLGGHEGGSAGFAMAKSGTRPKLRGTQYVNFDPTPGAPHVGVVPEFITDPGPVTLLTFFRAEAGYEMRIASGESVDMDPLPVQYEHTVFKPALPLDAYFRRIRDLGVCHHFALVHADLALELTRVAEILGMRVESLT